MQDTTENCRILLKEVEDSLHKRKDSPCSWIRRQWLRWQYSLIYRFSEIHIKSQTFFFFARMNKLIFRFMWKCKKSLGKIILKNKNKAEGLIHSEFKTYCKAKLSKSVWYWHRGRLRAQWSEIESPKINPCACGELFSYKVDTQEWKEYSFPEMVQGLTTGYSHAK